MSICIFSMALSLLAIFAEIMHAKYYSRKISKPLTAKNIHFTFPCKRSNYMNAIAKSNRLYQNILNEDGVYVLSSQTSTMFRDNNEFEISILMTLQVRKRDYLGFDSRSSRPVCENYFVCTITINF